MSHYCSEAALAPYRINGVFLYKNKNRKICMFLPALYAEKLWFSGRRYKVVRFMLPQEYSIKSIISTSSARYFHRPFTVRNRLFLKLLDSEMIGVIGKLLLCRYIILSIQLHLHYHLMLSQKKNKSHFQIICIIERTCYVCIIVE